MNTETGEIVHNPTEEQKKSPNMVKITGAEAEYLGDIPTRLRADALENFRALCRDMKFNTVFEKSKAMRAFYLGYAAACHKGELQ